KGARVARIRISSVALGAVDTALRVTLDFVTRREIFGTRVVDVPYTRRQLAECFADLLVAEAMATGAVRGLQANPGQASVFSSAVKFYVPTSLERTLAQLSVVLGARMYLRGDQHYGIYQKMLRDLPVATSADGNTVVNLTTRAVQADGLLPNVRGPGAGAAGERVDPPSPPDARLPEWAPADQQLVSRGQDATVRQLPASIQRLRVQAAAHP